MFCSLLAEEDMGTQLLAAVTTRARLRQADRAFPAAAYAVFVLQKKREVQPPELSLLHLSEFCPQPAGIQITQHLSPAQFRHVLHLRENRERIKIIASR